MIFMNIHVSYSHSAFPSHLASVGAIEMSSLHTKLRTTAEATVKLHNAFSPWSPHPVLIKDRVLPLIKRHWGPQKASEAMQQMLAQRSTLAPAHSRALPERDEQNMTQELLHHSYSPTISPRQMSIQGTQQMMAKSGRSTHPLPVNRVSHDSGIGMRGVSGGKVSGTGKRGKRGKGEKEDREDSLRRRWSITPDILRNLTPSLGSHSGGDRDKDGDDYKRNENKDKKHGATGNDKGKKDVSLWTWATWF